MAGSVGASEYREGLKGGKVQLTSSRKRYAAIAAVNEMEAEIKQGRKYGYCLMNGQSNSFGKRSAGFANVPPMSGLQKI